MLLKETDNEARTTRKMLACVPNDQYDWKPHEKSMTVRRLATHIAELPSWVSMTLTTDELDLANNPYQPVVINNTNDIKTLPDYLQIYLLSPSIHTIAFLLSIYLR